MACECARQSVATCTLFKKDIVVYISDAIVVWAGSFVATSNHIELEPDHLSAIRALANETHRSVDDVNKLYAETFERLNSDARIKDYLILLTSKTVRNTLRYSKTGT
jgi:hypothetical protein